MLFLLLLLRQFVLYFPFFRCMMFRFIHSLCTILFVSIYECANNPFKLIYKYAIYKFWRCWNTHIGLRIYRYVMCIYRYVYIHWYCHHNCWLLYYRYFRCALCSHDKYESRVQMVAARYLWREQIAQDNLSEYISANYSMLDMIMTMYDVLGGE